MGCVEREVIIWTFHIAAVKIRFHKWQEHHLALYTYHDALRRSIFNRETLQIILYRTKNIVTEAVVRARDVNNETCHLHVEMIQSS